MQQRLAHLRRNEVPETAQFAATSLILNTGAGFRLSDVEECACATSFHGRSFCWISSVVCHSAKQFGLSSSIAIDKVRKSFARSTIFQLDLTLDKDVALLISWMESPLLLWIHLAPVCGRASRARDIQRRPGDPLPLRSLESPDGLHDLNAQDRERVRIANRLYEVACYIFLQATLKGIVATMENPSNSYFWFTTWVLRLLLQVPVFLTDFQSCMYGGLRNKWTRILANFPQVQSMNVVCDHSRTHVPWGFATDQHGQRVWATSLESQYPRKLCIVLTSLVLHFAEQRGLTLKASTLTEEAENPMAATQLFHVGAGQQPKPGRIAPVVPDFSAVATFLLNNPQQIPCQLMSKLTTPLQLHTLDGNPIEVPAYARFLRITEHTAPVAKGVEPQVQPAYKFEAAFGLPWTWERFVARACETGHPSAMSVGVPQELQHVLEVHRQWNDAQLSKYRLDWCRRWIKRASDLDALEKQDALQRENVLAQVTSHKRLLLMREMLEEIGYEDMKAIDLLANGATLSGEVEPSPVFKQHFKPGLMTVEQLCNDASRRNQAVLNMTCSSGDRELDSVLLSETLLEIDMGWLEGPFSVEDLEPGATISRRFALRQGPKVRLIDDFSVSGVNDSCVSHGKIELHLVDTFTAMVRAFFRQCRDDGSDSSLVGKTL